jgi:hypothetical protein
MTTKPEITSLFLFSDGSVEIKIKEDDTQVTTINLASEKLKGLDLDQRLLPTLSNIAITG